MDKRRIVTEEEYRAYKRLLAIRQREAAIRAQIAEVQAIRDAALARAAEIEIEQEELRARIARLNAIITADSTQS